MMSINVNSFNLSEYDNPRESYKFYTKFNAILKKGKDIITIQDPRIATYKDVFEKEIRVTKFGRYKAFINSDMGRGGVLTLIKDRVNYKIHNIHRSDCQNVIILDLSINKFRFLIVNTYGPREVDPINNFYIELKNYIRSLNVKFFVILGDLNAVTNSTLPTPDNLSNIELYNMATVPCREYSRTLEDLIASGFLIDKFRVTNPNIRVFSFVPFQVGAERHNRSRIDNILCSPCFSKYIFKPEYLNKISSRYDHKPLCFTLGKSPKRAEPQIDQSLLSIPFTKEIAKYAIIETMIDHSNVPNKNELQESLAQINILSKASQALKCKIDNKEGNENEINEFKNQLEIKQNQLAQICNDFPPLEEIENYDFVIDYDDLLEVQLNALKNSIIAHQSNFIKEQNKVKNELTIEIEQLRRNGNRNSDRFKYLEDKLLEIENKENQRHLLASKHFDIVNQEKVTSHFAELFKNKDKEASMADICKVITDPDGSERELDFVNTQERNEYLKNYYNNLFGTPYENNMSINEFLGEFNNHDLVKQHKLTNEQKNRLETHFTIEELDKSLKTANSKSAPGLDGLGFDTLAFFWPFLRNSILKAFNKMIDKKELKGLMKCSKIRLLRKGKKNPKRVPNWRPISLLTAVYKLFSGIVNLRLQEIMDTCIHRSQKAYSDKRSIHENILNILETLGKAKNSNTPLATILVDFSRAFDSVSHDYIRKVLEFHNIGPFFIEIVMTTLKDRRACIIDEEGNFTEFFNIALGVLQGDREACQLFKFCLNPLLLKIILTPEIKLPDELPYSINRNEQKPDEVAGFADDLTLYSEPKIESFIIIKNIFHTFGEMSNLRLNMTKTKIIFHNYNPPPELVTQINNLGFTISDSIEVLGLEFSHDLMDIDKNWDKVLVKIKKAKNFWQLFHLSTPGKCNVIKTYFFSQVAYIGTLLNPPPAFLIEFEKLILDFLARGGDRISKKRVFAGTEFGGLGIPHPESFIFSLKIKSFLAGRNSNDIWGQEIRNLHNESGNIESLNINKINPANNPIIYNLLGPTIGFIKSFLLTDGNLKEMRILGNCIFESIGIQQITYEMFDAHTRYMYGQKLRELKVKDCLKMRSNNVDYQAFKNRTEIELSYENYDNLAQIMRAFNTKMKTKLSKSKALDIRKFISKKTLKSKHFRAYLEPKKSLNSCVPSKSRALWGGVALNHERESIFIQTWNQNYLPMSLRNFAFKLLNNNVKLKSQLHHFAGNGNISQSCTFCTLNNVNDPEKENYKHFLVLCNTTTNILNEYFTEFFSGKSIQWAQNMSVIGADAEWGVKNAIVINTEIIASIFYLDKCRKKRVLPSLNDLKVNNEHFRNLFNLSNKYKKLWAFWSNPNNLN